MAPTPIDSVNRGFSVKSFNFSSKFGDPIYDQILLKAAKHKSLRNVSGYRRASAVRIQRRK